MTVLLKLKSIASTALLLTASAAATDVKQHARTSNENWDIEATANALTWTWEIYPEGGFSLRIPNADSSCTGKLLVMPANTAAPVTSLFNSVFDLMSKDVELTVRYRKAPRQTYNSRCEIHSFAINHLPSAH